MHTYNMLAHGDRVLIAVSGGVDSLVLAWLLQFWQRKAPISYDFLAVHIDMEPEKGLPGVTAEKVRKQLDILGIRSIIAPAAWQPSSRSITDKSGTRKVCYHCSSSRRRQLFDFARRHQYNKIAFGHHQDDIIETFFINICFAGNISTMVPRQDLFSGRLSLIRPLAFLAKKDIIHMAQQLGFEPVRSLCPLREKTGRKDIRHILSELYDRVPEARQHIFTALANVRHEYLLKYPGKKYSGV